MTRTPASRRPPSARTLVALGLASGALVGAWAGRQRLARQSEPIDVTPATGTTSDAGAPVALIDWERARKIAISMHRRSALGEAERQHLSTMYRDMVQRTAPVVLRHMGIADELTFTDVLAVDRVDWINANMVGFERMLAPLNSMNLLGTSTGRAAAIAAGINRTVLSTELGVLLGYLARRVLGQYDLALFGSEPLDMSATGRLYFVHPNIEATETVLGVPAEQFRLWIALHETTHAVQFEGHPWLRVHMNGLITEYFRLLTGDIDYLGRGMALLKSLTSRSRSRQQSGATTHAQSGATDSWISSLMSPAQQTLFDQLQALMSVIEGHSTWLMNAAGREILPNHAAIAARFKRRQGNQSASEKLFARLIGLEMKREQYRLGESFFDAVVAERGAPFAHLVWRGTEWLPNLQELQQPSAWIQRADLMLRPAGPLAAHGPATPPESADANDPAAPTTP